MQITINGESRDFDQELTLAELLEQYELVPQRVAIELNEQLVRRARYAETRLHADDRVEIVTLVGGG
ncbi:MAG: sulfur carrier protein ThiS [Planctomycetota bacterium]